MAQLTSSRDLASLQPSAPDDWTTCHDTRVAARFESLDTQDTRFGSVQEVALCIQNSSPLPLDLAKLVSVYSADPTCWVPDLCLRLEAERIEHDESGPDAVQTEICCWLPLNNAVLVQVNSNSLLVLHLDTLQLTRLSLPVLPSPARESGLHIACELPNGLIAVFCDHLYIFKADQSDFVGVFQLQQPPQLSDEPYLVAEMIALGTTDQPYLIVQWDEHPVDVIAHYSLPASLPTFPALLPYCALQSKPGRIKHFLAVSSSHFLLLLAAPSGTRGLVYQTIEAGSSNPPLSSVIGPDTTALVRLFLPWMLIDSSGRFINSSSGEVIARTDRGIVFTGIIHADSESTIFEAYCREKQRVFRLDHQTNSVQEVRVFESQPTCLDVESIRIGAVKRVGECLWTLHTAPFNQWRLVRWTGGVPSSSL